MAYQDHLPNLITTTDLANELGVDVSAVTNWQRRLGDFPEAVFVTGKTRFFDRDAVFPWVAAHYASRIASHENAVAQYVKQIAASEAQKKVWEERLQVLSAIQSTNK